MLVTELVATLLTPLLHISVGLPAYLPVHSSVSGLQVFSISVFGIEDSVILEYRRDYVIHRYNAASITVMCMPFAVAGMWCVVC